MNKTVTVVLCVLLSLVLLTGCNTTFKPVVPEGITNPEGGIVSTNPPTLEGWIVKISKDKITVMVQNVEWDMELDPWVQEDVERYEELDMPMKRGGYVLVQYETMEDGTKLVNRLEHLNAN